MTNSDDSDKDNVWIALLLVIGAGAATALGSMVVFFPSLVKYANRKTLAGALGLSAGVMCYVSFVEIFQKSIGSFGDADFSEDDGYLYATLCFFGGVVAMMLLNYGVTALLRGEHHHGHSHGPENFNQKEQTRTTSTQNVSQETQNNNSNPQTNPGCPCCSDDPVKDLEDIQKQAIEAEEKLSDEGSGHGDHEHTPDCERNSKKKSETESNPADDASSVQNDHDAKLMSMSINTALAIALHNFPEGLATFVATLNDPKVGAVLAVAIAIHNIPEGLCVAMPIFYATGNRRKAFWWGVLSGASEPVAAFLGWAVLANSFSDTLYAVLFGLVSGMMVVISVRELLPTAHRYDPDDSVVTLSFIAGMIIMALSLVLFVI